ncbi:MAG: efflux RND transporter permease subunit [Flavobacteriales bacterium]|nr:efflux RND transporter permease subunit [Flavobacteriales bacterium]MCX7768708.1 efflux RND transporter permease subunit [Flavobacteriales bacterium]MDW8410093.1 efflux RND transporter permease subunit [Flavobacteriales bacterium]
MRDSRRKTFAPSSFALRNKTSVYMLVVIIFVAGLMAYSAMPRESFPEIVQPTIFIGTAYPGNSPVDIENLVTRPIEKELKSLKKVKKFTSTSIQDYSTIVVEFESDVSPSKALADVKDKVDKARTALPQDLPSDPDVFELDFSEFPILNVNLSGPFTYDELKTYAEYLEEEIEKLPQISQVDIRGLVEKEVEIAVDLPAMEANKINFNDIENAVRTRNISSGAGDILSISGEGFARRSLRIAGEFENPAELENVIVKNEFQRVVYLRDIAQVRFGPIEPTSFARLDGQPVVMLDVKKKSGENLVQGVDAIRRLLDEARQKKLPRDLKITLTNDQSVITRRMVNNLENNIISGVILVVGVLLFFLGFRNAIFVGSAIPLSMILGILVLNASGATLNMMVLFSLILALGMLVDNGIVVVENIYRLHSEGFSRWDASRYGVGEVAVPIISSTATTLAAFFPLLFWDSLIGEFMKYLPITLLITLSASLFVGLFVNPVLTSDFMLIRPVGFRYPAVRFWRGVLGAALVGGILVFFRPVRPVGTLFLLGVVFAILYRFLILPASEFFQQHIMPAVEKAYRKFLQWTLSRWRPLLLFGGTLFLLVGAMAFYFGSNPKVLFFPETQPRYVNVFVEMPLGTDILTTDSITRILEKRIQARLAPEKAVVEAILAQVGEGTSDPSEGPSLGKSPHKARITVSFLPYEERIRLSSTPTSVLQKWIRDTVQGIPMARITVEKNTDGPPVGKPINIEISGDNYDTLVALTERMVNFLEAAAVPGVDKLKTDLEVGKPELLLELDYEAARRYGVSVYDVATNLRTALFGKEISKFKTGEDDYKIQLRLQPQYRYNLDHLLNMRITFRNMVTGQIAQVPLSAIATVKYSSSFGSIKRKNMDRVVSIFSNVIPGYNANEIIGHYSCLLAGFPMPEGYSYKFTGEQQEQNESVGFLSQAMLIAVFLIFLIIVSQFNSILTPFIIMFSVVFSTIGVFLGFGLFKMDFVILMCGIGIISLAGVVVNNAIVLIDYNNLLRARYRESHGIPHGEPLPFPVIKNLMTEAGSTRLRPVLLTAITTVLGLIPLAIGLNIDFIGFLSRWDANIFLGGDSVAFWGPMSWTVIFGLTFATFLTLVVVPAMVILAERIQRSLRALYYRMAGHF